jgi:hypothetical protein
MSAATDVWRRDARRDGIGTDDCRVLGRPIAEGWSTALAALQATTPPHPWHAVVNTEGQRLLRLTVTPSSPAKPRLQHMQHWPSCQAGTLGGDSHDGHVHWSLEASQHARPHACCKYSTRHQQQTNTACCNVARAHWGPSHDCSPPRARMKNNMCVMDFICRGENWQPRCSLAGAHNHAWIAPPTRFHPRDHHA